MCAISLYGVMFSQTLSNILNSIVFLIFATTHIENFGVIIAFLIVNLFTAFHYSENLGAQNSITFANNWQIKYEFYELW